MAGKSVRPVVLRSTAMMLVLLSGMLTTMAGCGLRDESPPTPTSPSAVDIPPTRQALPDLVVNLVDLEYASDAAHPCPAPAGVLQMRLEVFNRGDAPAGTFVVKVNQEQQTISELPAGQGLPLTFSILSPDVQVWVDAAGQVFERDEGNNRLVRFLPTPTPSEACRPTPTPRITYQEATYILQGHTGPVMSVAFSPEGNLVASGSTDNTLRLWIAREGRLLRTMVGHNFPILNVCFTPDGATMITGSMDGLVRLWRVSNGSLTRTLSGHAGWITSLDVSMDGKLLASSAEDFTVRLWRLPSGNPIQTIDEGMAQVTALHFAPNDHWLGWSEMDGTVRVRALTGEWLQILKETRQAATGSAFSPDSSLLAAGFEDGTIRIWQTADGALLQTLLGHTRAVTDLAFSNDGRWLVSASADGTLRLWPYEDRAFSNLPMIIYAGHDGAVNSVAISSTDAYIASGGHDGTVRLWALPQSTP